MSIVHYLVILGIWITAIFIVLIKEEKKKFNNMINELTQDPPYPEIDIRHDVTNKGVPIEHLMDYPYRISGTCNKIDYTWQRFRGWPTEFQIARFRYHCIYEYEKSGKSKIVDYEVCDGYEEPSFSND